MAGLPIWMEALLHHSKRHRLARILQRAGAWLRLLRLQFYPMAWVAYTIGALAARRKWQWRIL